MHTVLLALECDHVRDRSEPQGALPDPASPLRPPSAARVLLDLGRTRAKSVNSPHQVFQQSRSPRRSLLFLSPTDALELRHPQPMLRATVKGSHVLTLVGMGCGEMK